MKGFSDIPVGAEMFHNLHINRLFPNITQTALPLNACFLSIIQAALHIFVLQERRNNAVESGYGKQNSFVSSVTTWDWPIKRTIAENQLAG